MTRIGLLKTGAALCSGLLLGASGIILGASCIIPAEAD